MIVQSAPTLETIRIQPSYQRSKRLLDISLTILLLPVLAPIMLLIALCIRFDSPGPILYRQKRTGQDGVEFDLFKFRSMYVNNDDVTHRVAIQRFMNGHQINEDAQGTNLYKLGSDKRITRIGKFIRKTSLDELPQFFNVFRGEMSLVGPRPPLSYEVDLYDARDKLRLTGKPGLTGVWQVYGRSRVSFKEMVEMDITYLQAQSLRQDLKLIVLTVPVMILARGGA
jgi:lipopolysaccharide/colanic/teichoic acid biosynthesis glycosyltransferase